MAQLPFVFPTHEVHYRCVWDLWISVVEKVCAAGVPCRVSRQFLVDSTNGGNFFKVGIGIGTAPYW